MLHKCLVYSTIKQRTGPIPRPVRLLNLLFLSFLCTRPFHTSYFDLNLPSDILPPIPSREAEIYMLSLHILKHAMGPGFGLRQECDLAMALHTPGYDSAVFKRYFRRNGLKAWNNMLCSFITERLLAGQCETAMHWKTFYSAVVILADTDKAGKQPVLPASAPEKRTRPNACCAACLSPCDMLLCVISNMCLRS